MKKSIILGAMLLSTVAFAKGYNQDGETKYNTNNARGANKFANLSEEQIAQIQALRVEHFKAAQADRLEVEGLNIEIEQLLAEENVDWNSVNAKVQEVAKLEAALELDMLKAHEEVKAVLGDDAPMMAFGRGQGRDGKGSKEGQRGGQERGMRDKERDGEKGRSQEYKGMGKDREDDNYRGRDKEESKGRGYSENRDNKTEGYKEGKRDSSKEGFGRYSDLTEEQVAKIKELKEGKADERYKTRLEMASINNDIQKLLIADNIDWTAVEAKLNEKVGHKVVARISNYETREAIEDITGDEIIGLNKGRSGAKTMHGRGNR